MSMFTGVVQHSSFVTRQMIELYVNIHSDEALALRVCKCLCLPGQRITSNRNTHSISISTINDSSSSTILYTYRSIPRGSSSALYSQPTVPPPNSNWLYASHSRHAPHCDTLHPATQASPPRSYAPTSGAEPTNPSVYGAYTSPASTSGEPAIGVKLNAGGYGPSSCICWRLSLAMWLKLPPGGPV